MKRYGLIGYPLGHSFSARYFADKFAREGIADCRYDLYELKTIEELPALLEAQPELRGFNVTIPYKQQIIPYLDDLSPETRMIGAVNCVRCEGRRLTGYNTDVTGLRASLETFLGGERPERALVLGTGGASQAVQYVLAQMEIPFDLVSRNPATGNYTYDEVSDEVIGSHRLIINASPTGIFSPGRTANISPFCTCSIGTMISLPSFISIAVCGASLIRLLSASVVLPLERASSVLPTVIRVSIIAADSK